MKTMRNLFFCLFLAMLVSGCGVFKPAPEIRYEHIVVAPQDNLLVDCDVEAPPVKSLYLSGITLQMEAPPAPPDALVYQSEFHLQQYVMALRNAGRRETLLTDLANAQYKNVDVCNQRWAKLREWKAAAVQQLTNKKKE